MGEPPSERRRSAFALIDSVRNKIERCIEKYMSFEETMKYLQDNHKIHHAIIKRIWAELEKNNPEFFKNYYLRCEILRQTKLFNDSLMKQLALMLTHGHMNIANASSQLMTFLTQDPQGIRLLANLPNTSHNNLGVIITVPMVEIYSEQVGEAMKFAERVATVELGVAGVDNDTSDVKVATTLEARKEAESPQNNILTTLGGSEKQHKAINCEVEITTARDLEFINISTDNGGPEFALEKAQLKGAKSSIPAFAIRCRFLCLLLCLLITWINPAEATNEYKKVVFSVEADEDWLVIFTVCFVVGGILLVVLAKRFLFRGVVEEDLASRGVDVGIQCELNDFNDSAPRGVDAGIQCELKDSNELSETDSGKDAVDFLEGGSHANELVDFVQELEAKETLGDLAQGLTTQQVVRKFTLSKAQSTTGTGCVMISGFYEQRPVLVRRCVQTEQTKNETNILCLVDGHENILTYHGSEIDGDSFYYALEPWSCSLAELIRFWRSRTLVVPHYWNKVLEVDNLWTKQLDPSPLLMKLIRDIVKGIAHLHDKEIIHRDLRPENVMIICDRNRLVAKIDNLGIALDKKEFKPPLSHHRDGDNGWRAPEQLGNEEETTAVDMFNLGVLIFHTITGGSHPFGNRGPPYYNQNIKNNKTNLTKVDKYPEALDLIRNLVNGFPEPRLKALEVLNHPFFWNSDEKLDFLAEASDKMRHSIGICTSIENDKEKIIGVGAWSHVLDVDYWQHLSSRHNANYDVTQFVDLIRAIRNTRHHYDTVPRFIKRKPAFKDGIYMYYATLFPALLIHVHKVIYANCRSEQRFQRFFESKTF